MHHVVEEFKPCTLFPFIANQSPRSNIADAKQTCNVHRRVGCQKLKPLLAAMQGGVVFCSCSPTAFTAQVYDFSALIALSEVQWDKTCCRICCNSDHRPISDLNPKYALQCSSAHEAKDIDYCQKALVTC